MPTCQRSIRQIADGYVVRYKYGQKERRKKFENLEDAKEFVRGEQRRIRAFGESALELTGGQLGRVLSLVYDLAPLKADGSKQLTEGVIELELAAKAWVKERQTEKEKLAGQAITVGDAIARLISAWKKEGKNKQYISNAGGVLRRYAADYSNILLRDCQPAAVKDWVLGFNSGMRPTAKARLSALFAFGVLNRWISENPCALFRLDRQKKQVVVVPKPDQIQEFLRLAELPGWKVLVPYFALRFFSGLRASEAVALRWEHVSFEGNKIIVPAGIAAKNGPARQIPASANLIAWLRKYSPERLAGQIAPQNVGELEKDFRRENGYATDEWHNALRHAYGSYRASKVGSLDQLALEMGNSRQVLCSHYLGAVSDAEAEAFWAILPKS